MSSNILFKRVIVAVSGGVDSAVSALLLKRKGFEVQGVFMRNWDDTDEMGFCSADKDAADAEWICQFIGIKFHYVNFVKEYWNMVFMSMLQEYESGFTPNPDILCNQKVKFDCFYKHAVESIGTDAIATGHYALTSFGDFLQHYKINEECALLKAVDNKKDQTFFLSRVPQFALQRTMFPVGNLLKKDVKTIASSCGMGRLLNKKETRGICFIGERNFPVFISEYINPSLGNFVDIDTGEVVGTHNGIHLWTCGQRSKIPGQPEAYYIVKKDAKTNNILVASGDMHPSLYTQFIYTSQPYWIRSAPDDFEFCGYLKCKFRLRHSQELRESIVTYTAEQNLVLHTCEPEKAVSPGQYVVLYTDHECLGSAQIIYAGPSLMMLKHQIHPFNDKEKELYTCHNVLTN